MGGIALRPPVRSSANVVTPVAAAGTNVLGILTGTRKSACSWLYCRLSYGGVLKDSLTGPPG